CVRHQRIRLPNRWASPQFRSETILQKSERRPPHRSIYQLSMAAAKMAVEDSGIDVEKLDRRDRFGVIISTGIGGLKTLQDQLTILLTKGPSRNSPFTIPMLISNMANGVISMEFNLHGPNLCIVTACATSNN